MLNRRTFLGGLSASLPIIALPGTPHAQAGPKLHAMVVGIDHYTGQDGEGPIEPLKGCVNDANDIAAQVRPLATSVRVLLGTEKGPPVTRKSFFSSWQEMMDAARAGDTLLLTFSGHGFQVPEGIPGNERDAMDETLALTGYDINHARDVAEHIIDDELDRLFREAHAKRLIVVFVSDSCHSGTVYRKVELADVRYRNLRPGPLTRGRPTVVPRQSTPPEDPPNLVFLAGSQEDERVPEINVNGQWRGALSVAVARALEGGRAARNGVITAYGLSEFVLSYVRSLSDAGQHPNVTWGGSTRASIADAMTISGDTRLIVLGQPPPPPPFETNEIGSVRLRIAGPTTAEQQRIVRGLTNATVVGDGEPASLTWRAGERLVFNDQGHRVAEGVDARQLQHAVEHRRALDRLIRVAGGNRLDVSIRIPPGAPPSAAADATHKPGTKFDIVISGVGDDHYFTVFNLTGNGKVQMLKPTPYRRMEDVPHRPNFDGRDFRTGARKDRGARDIVLGGGFVEKDGPFGAEHVVVVAGALPLGRLMPALVEAHNKFAVADAMAALASEARMQPLRAGFQGIYSARE